MFCVYYVMLFYATTSPCSILVGVWSFNSNTRPTGSWCVHILHWSSYNALWNVGLLIRGQSLLYCVNSFKMAVCCGQSPWIHTILSLLLPQSCSDVYPTSLPSPSGARCHSVSLLALTVVLALITYSTGGESTSLYAYVRITTELTHCALCVLLYSSIVIALPVCVMNGV